MKGTCLEADKKSPPPAKSEEFVALQVQFGAAYELKQVRSHLLRLRLTMQHEIVTAIDVGRPASPCSAPEFTRAVDNAIALCTGALQLTEGQIFELSAKLRGTGPEGGAGRS